MSGTGSPEAVEARAIYPWFLSLFPILHLYSVNLGFLRDHEVPIALLVSLGGTTLVYLTLRLATRRPHASGLATAVLLFIFFFYGHIAQLIGAEGETRWETLLPLIAAAVACGLLAIVWRLRSSSSLGAVTKSLNWVTAALLLLPGFTVATHWARALWPGSVHDVTVGERPNRRETVLNDAQHPDVYYIIADAYSSNVHLLRDYGYDNSAFTSELEELGFFVAYDSKSNYGATLPSLSSSLNMRYVSENPSGLANDLAYLRALIADSEVARLFMDRGYTYVNMLSGYLMPSSFADINIDFTPDGVTRINYDELSSNVTSIGAEDFKERRFFKHSFYEALADTTLLYTVRDRIAPLIESRTKPYGHFDTRRFFATLAELKTVPALPEATFTFVHLMEPHAPVRLDRHGNRLKYRPGKPTPEEFFDELEFVNEQYLEALETLIEASSVPPIIVLQADHGSDLGRVWTPDETLTHFEIMNAFFFPGDRPPGLEADISPVNTFRVLLNAYFGTDFELLDVRLFDIPEGYDALFEQVDVTDEFS